MGLTGVIEIPSNYLEKDLEWRHTWEGTYIEDENSD